MTRDDTELDDDEPDTTHCTVCGVLLGSWDVCPLQVCNDCCKYHHEHGDD